jgi:hypothetical protein
MSFLVPLFLAGLATVAIAVVVHLTRKQKAEQVPFPSLMFLQRVPYEAESRRRVHNWLLLALAFARPFLVEAGTPAPGGGGPVERVVLLDRSWSMEAGERWPEAVAAAREAAGGLGPLDRFSLVVFDGGAQAVVRGTSSAERARAVLDTLTLSDRGTRYGPALKLARTILEESELPGREVILISDLQRSGWQADEGALLPPGAELRVVRVGGSPPGNAAVADVTLTRERVRDQERIVPVARLTRVGGEGAVEVQAILEVEGREVQRRAVTLPAAGAEQVAFEPFTVSAPHTPGTVRLVRDGDGSVDADLTRDDVRHFVASPGRDIRVLLLDAPGDGGRGSLYLREALEISRGTGFQVDRSEGGVPVAGALEPYQVVILHDRPVPGGSEAERLRAFVRQGGGLFIVAGSRGGWGGDVADFVPGTLGAARDREAGRGGRLGWLDYEHPVFEIFRGPRRGDFSAARIFRARSWQLPPGDSVRVVARFDDGSPALAERLSGEGRVMVWAGTLDALWTDLALQPVFLPFVHQVVGHASGRTETLEAFEAGQILDVTDARAMATAGLGQVTRALAAAEARVAIAPSGDVLELGSGAGPRFLELSEGGFYEIRPPGRDDVRPVTVAVNVDPAEAEIEPLDAEELRASLVTPGGTGPRGERAVELQRADQERRQGLWRWLLAGAFALLVAETVVSNRAAASRRPLSAPRGGG